MSSTRNTIRINASRETVYRAFTDPLSREQWQAPGEMTAKVHRFDLRVGGGYEMSLFYPASDTTARGKTVGKEDRFTSRFVELVPPSRIVEAVNFNSPDPAFAGEMIMEVSLASEGSATKVTIQFDNIPTGVDPKDNALGTQLTLEKLARFVEGRTIK